MANCKVIALCNQKGVVGKTTTTANLGIGLVMTGKKALLVDADAQGKRSDLTSRPLVDKPKSADAMGIETGES